MITLSRVKQATAEFIKILRYGEKDVQTSDQYLPFGIDSKPIKEMLAAQARTGNSEDTVIFGYLVESAETEEGEIRLYSTDAEGAAQFYIKLLKTGTCEFGGDSDNLVRFSALETAYNQLKQDFDDFISQTYNLHAHPTAAVGAPSPPTLAGTSSTGDISGAKIEEIKTL